MADTVRKLHRLQKLRTHNRTACGIECWPTNIVGEADTACGRNIEFAQEGQEVTCNNCLRRKVMP